MRTLSWLGSNLRLVSVPPDQPNNHHDMRRLEKLHCSPRGKLLLSLYLVVHSHYVPDSKNVLIQPHGCKDKRVKRVERRRVGRLSGVYRVDV